MNKIIFGITFLLVLSPEINAQWVQQYSGNPSILFTINFVNNNDGFAAGANESFLRTTNGGNEWVVINQGGSSDFYADMFFIDAQTGWTVLGGWSPYRHGSILKTTNGGLSWITQLYLDEFLFISVYFVDEEYGWAVGTNGIIFKTTNGGNTWNFQYQLSTYEWLYDVYFIDRSTGWAVGNIGNRILKTTNGGNTWQLISIGTDDWLFDIEFFDGSIGLAVGDNGRILRSTNSGSSWNVVSSGTNLLFRDVEISSNEEAWAVGLSGIILHSVNIGLSWSTVISGATTDLYSVSFVGSSKGWICGNDQVILHNSSIINDPINMVVPNGGEIWTEGTQQDIIWTSTGIPSVKIDLSINNGLSWSTIIDSTLSTGIYFWEIPVGISSDSCLIKISDAEIPDTFDISDDIFSIKSQASLSAITVTSPNGGENWTSNTLHDITWISEYVDYVKIELSLNNGSTWDTIVDSTLSTGIYSWSVTAQQSSVQSRIRITHITDLNVYDISDAVFTIQVPVDVEDQLSNLPEEFRLLQNFPNPFNPSTTISFDLPQNAYIKLKIMNSIGEQVFELVQDHFPAGRHEIVFNSGNLSSGLYIYSIQALDENGKIWKAEKKMILLK